jgi:predicted ABC-type ATPase
VVNETGESTIIFMTKKIIIIAGPNGAGKTTFARSFLPLEADCPRFINADLIAAGLSPFAPETAALKAGRLMLQETTLSGKVYLNHIDAWQALGYRVGLFFLSLPNAEAAIARVAERVKQGGHNIPQDVIKRRFESGYKNFRNYYSLKVNAWSLYDNSGVEPLMIEWGEN